MAALSWSYLLWTIKLIWRGAPQKMVLCQIIGSILRYDEYVYIYLAYQVCTYEYKIWYTILHIKMAGWLLPEAAQTSLSNLMLLAVSYDVMLHFSRTALALVSCEPNEYARVEQNSKKKKEKQHHRVLRACIRLLCTWERIECTVYLVAT